MRAGSKQFQKKEAGRELGRLAGINTNDDGRPVTGEHVDHTSNRKDGMGPVSVFNGILGVYFPRFVEDVNRLFYFL